MSRELTPEERANKLLSSIAKIIGLGNEEKDILRRLEYYRNAETLAREALHLNPNSAKAHWRLADIILGITGNEFRLDEGLEEITYHLDESERLALEYKEVAEERRRIYLHYLMEGAKDALKISGKKNNCLAKKYSETALRANGETAEAHYLVALAEYKISGEKQARFINFHLWKAEKLDSSYKEKTKELRIKLRKNDQ
ncbi:hypothetical protein J4216_03235 [Candidatus Woesearchaeota archaeon]|nr:hypothetical protein [Candidatus Woesearchaeota archaeon]